MSSDHNQPQDPLQFVRSLWGNMGFSLPGMVAPTFDVDELEKRIADLKAVEGWLRMNLSMLQMTIQGLEMQKTTVGAVRAMGEMAQHAAQQAGEAVRQASDTPAASEAAKPAAAEAQPAEGSLQAALWPWQMMQEMQAHLQRQATPQPSAEEKSTAKKPASRARKPEKS